MLYDIITHKNVVYRLWLIAILILICLYPSKKCSHSLQSKITNYCENSRSFIMTLSIKFLDYMTTLCLNMFLKLKYQWQQ